MVELALDRTLVHVLPVGRVQLAEHVSDDRTFSVLADRTSGVNYCAEVFAACRHVFLFVLY